MKTNSLRILYTDDDPDDFDLFREGMLQVAPQHTLHYLQHSKNFVAEVREFLPDLIFLDYNMPLCDGKDCLLAIKADPAFKHIPIVMYCTSSSNITLTECFELGAARYLLKPVDYAGICKGLELLFDLYYTGSLLGSEFDHFFINTYKMN